jgi:hypothetical protein
MEAIDVTKPQNAQVLGPVSGKILSVSAAIGEVLGDYPLPVDLYRKLHFARAELVDACAQAFCLEKNAVIPSDSEVA